MIKQSIPHVFFEFYITIYFWDLLEHQEGLVRSVEHFPKISGDGLINFFWQEPGVSRDWNSFSDEHPCPKSVIHSMSCIACCEYLMLFGFISFASCKGFWCISFRLCNIICGTVLTPVTSHWSSHSNWAPLSHVDLPLLLWGTRVELRENLCHPFYSRQTQARNTHWLHPHVQMFKTYNRNP